MTNSYYTVIITTYSVSVVQNSSCDINHRRLHVYRTLVKIRNNYNIQKHGSQACNVNYICELAVRGVLGVWRLGSCRQDSERGGEGRSWQTVAERQSVREPEWLRGTWTLTVWKSLPQMEVDADEKRHRTRSKGVRGTSLASVWISRGVTHLPVPSLSTPAILAPISYQQRCCQIGKRISGK